MKRRLESLSTGLQWEAWLEGNRVLTSLGRPGGPARAGARVCANAAEAARELELLVAAKLGEGYVRLGAPRPAPVLPPSDDRYAVQEHNAGVPLGTDLRALFDLASEQRPEEPSTAFECLDFGLDWLARPPVHPDAMRVPNATPRDVLPLGCAGDSLDHFGFRMEPGDSRPLDARAVVYVRGSERSAETIAPDLAAFLSLVSMHGARGMRRDLSDAAWSRNWDVDGTDEQRSAVRALRRLPRVGAISLPSALASAAPETASCEKASPSRFRLARSPAEAAIQARAELDAGRFDNAIAAARVGSSDPYEGCRAELVLIEALLRGGQRDQAAEAWSQTAQGWLAGWRPAVFARHWQQLHELHSRLELAPSWLSARVDSHAHSRDGRTDRSRTRG